MHLNAIETVPLTNMTLPLCEVKTERSHTVSTHLGIVLLSEKFTNFREQIGISRWIGTWRFSDRLLVYIDKTFDMANTADAFIFR